MIGPHIGLFAQLICPTIVCAAHLFAQLKCCANNFCRRAASLVYAAYMSNNFCREWAWKPPDNYSVPFSYIPIPPCVISEEGNIRFAEGKQPAATSVSSKSCVIDLRMDLMAPILQADRPQTDSDAPEFEGDHGVLSRTAAPTAGSLSLDARKKSASEEVKVGVPPFEPNERGSNKHGNPRTATSQQETSLDQLVQYCHTLVRQIQ